MSRIIFVTATDTGVGKSVLTGLLLAHLRDSGVRALAMKPFCSGGTGDVELIQGIQGMSPSRGLVNPFYFEEPLAPLVAARRERRVIRMSRVLRAIRAMQRLCECLIVEGAGGVLMPLGERSTVADLIARLGCEVVVVGSNRLGVLNHALLSVEALRTRGTRQIKVVLMEQEKPDNASRTNARVLREFLENIEVHTIPFLGRLPFRPDAIKRGAKKSKKVLVRVLDFAIVCPRSLERGSKCRTK